jgi:peptide/bleomycin uptake transporter
MFKSFFPSPKIFFTSASIWGLACVLLWFFGAKEWGHYIGLLNRELVGAESYSIGAFLSAPFVWFYIYYAVGVGLFAAVWWKLSPHRWFGWSVLGSSLIIFVLYFNVQVSVAINAWFGEYFDLIQKALNKPKSVPASELFAGLGAITGVLMTYIVIAVMLSYFTSHYIFRWRAAMNDYYTVEWQKLRLVEGASQRVQEDTKRFASTVEDLGTRLISAIMTLIAFLPILAGLSAKVSEIPIFGIVPYSLVIVALVWSIFGTGLLAVAGIKLPGLEFRNQRVEAAYRKELVYGEDKADRAEPQTLRELFGNLRKNYFNLYFHYMYFNVVRYSYLQADLLLPFFVLIPSVAAGTITFGVFQQVRSSFGEVRDAMQYLVNSWPDIIELISIFKRLRAFEATLTGQEIEAINLENEKVTA